MNENIFEYILNRVISNALDADMELQENKNDLFYQGKKLAYYEILDTIKNELEIYDEDLKKYNLEIDINSLV